MCAAGIRRIAIVKHSLHNISQRIGQLGDVGDSSRRFQPFALLSKLVGSCSAQRREQVEILNRIILLV